MKTFIPSILCAGLLLAAGVPSLRAEQPASAGKVLVLEGDRTLEGDVERVGDQYRVRRAVGETWLPADRVLRLCADYAAALDYLRGRTNLQDADERLRLAQWCLDRGLVAQALVEVKAAADLRPDHAATKKLLERLQHQPAASPVPMPVAQPAPEPDPTPIDLTIEALAQFTTKVQPILMNACAGCHANGKGGAFRLTRVNDGPTLNRRTMQLNLAVVIQQVNPQQPHNSRLLTKSVSLHGGMDKNPPLANRQAPAYRALEEWVRLTVENNPQLLDRVVALPTEGKAGPSGFAAEPRPALPAPTPDETPRPAAPLPMTVVPVDKPPTAATNDPFDPDEFNRQEHPDRASPPAKKPG